MQLTEGELESHRRVREMVQGDAEPGRHYSDAYHVVESAKYGGGYFVTRDRRPLRKSTELETILQIKVVSPSDFMTIYREFEATER